MNFDTQEANVKLIKQIKLRPCLYNKKLPTFNRKSVQDKAWDEIAKYMGWQAGQCKERWRNLRCVYIRHIKRLNQGIPTRPYYLMKLMSFALPHFKLFNNDPLPKELMDTLLANDDTESETNGDEEEHNNTQKTTEITRHNETESPEPLDSFVTEFLPATSIQLKHETDSQSSDLSPENDSHISPSRARPRMATNDFDLEIPDFSTNIDLKTDARKMFLYSLLPDVYAMSDAQMRQFKLKVLNIIGNILDSDIS